jgi:hypothetical protein
MRTRVHKATTVLTLNQYLKNEIGSGHHLR